MIVDLFSGMRGWEISSPLRYLKTWGFDNNEIVCETSRRNGFGCSCISCTDVTMDGFTNISGVVASPPCTTFSPAGKGKGRNKLHLIMEVLRMMRSSTKYYIDIDPISRLVLEPMRWVLYHKPYFVALEQVPSVQPIWNGYATLLRSEGYSVATGILGAEQFGLGTTRKRSYLIASREKSISLPVPTHSSFYPHRPQNLDPSLPKWKSMADVLGWGMTHRPAPTVTAGGTDTGGAEVFGNGTRQRLRKEYEEGRWLGDAYKPRPSVEDIKKLHGVPEDYYLHGNKTQQQKQLGNIMLPGMADILIKELL